jgi:1,4-alpha-glucan branching enzyme
MSKLLSGPLTDFSAWVGSAPQAHSRVSNINFDILKKKIGEGGLYKYHMKNISRMAKFLPTLALN